MMSKPNLPYNHSLIIEILKKGGRIEMSSTNNRVIDVYGKHQVTITDSERRAIVENYDLKPKFDPIYHWVWQS